MRYTGPAFLHLTHSEVAEVVRHLPSGGSPTMQATFTRMNAWLAYVEATNKVHGGAHEASWNPQTRSHDA